MKKITIVVDDVPPSNNKFIGRNNRWSYQEYKRAWKILMRSGMKDIPKKPIEKAKVHINYIFPTRTRRDPDNFSGKLILDPLVQYGIIVDDNFSCIELSLSAKYEKGVKQTTVTVTEILSIRLKEIE